MTTSFSESDLAKQLIDEQRLVRAATLVEEASELLWKAGVSLRAMSDSRKDNDEHGGIRRMNYDVCKLRDEVMKLAQSLTTKARSTVE